MNPRNVAQVILTAQDRTGAAFSSVQKSLSGLGSSIGLTQRALAGLGAAGVTTYLGNIVRQTAAAGQEISRLSALSNTGVRTFQEYAFAAERFGISQQKLADIFKDTQDKVGDFLQNGGGPLKDFFDNIAPQVGVTAEQFRRLSGPEALQLYVSSLQKANLSQSEMTFYLEAIASDSAMLLPLLRDNGRAFNELAAEARSLGKIMSEESVEAARQFSDNLNMLKAAGDGLTTSIGNALIPTLVRLSNEFLVGMKNADGFFDALSTFGLAGVFETPAAGAKKYRDELQKLQEARQRLIDNEGVLANTAGFDRQIELAARRLAYFNELQRRGATFGADDQSMAEARRLGLVPGAVSTAPTRTTTTTTRAARPAASVAPFTGLSYQESIMQGVGRLLEDSDLIRAQRFADTMRELDELFFQGSLSPELYESALKKLTGTTEETGKATEDMAEKITDAGKQFDTSAALAESIANGILDGARRGESIMELFRTELKAQFAKTILTPTIKPVVEGINSLIGSGLSWLASSLFPNAMGGVYSGAGISAYSGQVVNRPTVFPFAKGIGLMGEAGPEAIMPLKRGPDGRLGVQAAGGGGNVYNFYMQPTIGSVASQGDVVAGMQTVRAQILSDLQRSARYGGALAS